VRHSLPAAIALVILLGIGSASGPAGFSPADEPLEDERNGNEDHGSARESPDDQRRARPGSQ
jgi:hypothetical protein